LTRSGLSLRRAIVVIRSSPILGDGLSSRMGNRQKVRLRNPRPIGALGQNITGIIRDFPDAGLI
jgi:hypothetical protein